MKRKGISFYLNSGFIIVLVAILVVLGLGGYAFLHRLAVKNVLDRLEVSLEEAKTLYEARNARIMTVLSDLAYQDDIDEYIASSDQGMLDSRISRLGEHDIDSTYFLVVDADGTILSSPQENVGGQWGLAHLLEPLSEDGERIFTCEVLPEEYVSLCSESFRDMVHVSGADDSIPDVDYACLSICMVPIHDESGTLLGALVGGYVLNNDHDFAELYTEHVPETYLSAGAADGTRISSNIETGDFSFPVGTRQVSPFIDVLNAGDPWRGTTTMADGREGVVAADPVFNYEGEVIGNIGVGAPLFLFPELSGATFVLPMLAVVALFIFAALVASVITRIVTTPITQLRNIAREVAKEKTLPRDTDIKGTIVPAEINDLTSDILTMAGEITYENARLEDRVRERTLQLDNTIVKLRESNRYKSQFLANISHELRTPLNSIIGFASLLKDRVPGPINSTQEQYTDVIIDSGNHLLDLINDIIQLVKVDTGVEKPIATPMNLPLLVHTTATSIYPTFNNRSQSLIVEVEDEENFPVVNWDEKKIRQVLLNLLTNASKFTPEGGSVIVRTTLTEDGGFVAMDVIDNGIGIADEMKERVFLAFEQADASYTRLYKGVGLGLAITKEIVEMHEGLVWLEDNPEGGTQVRMVIPIDPFDSNDQIVEGTS